MTAPRPILRDSFIRDAEAKGRRRFGLDTPLPADPWVVERAILRFLATERPSVLPLQLAQRGEARNTKRAAPPGPNGLPDLLLLLGGGRAAFFKIKTQAQRLSTADRAFADLCRERAIPVVVVRSLGEARAALDTLTANPRGEP